jgi:hypothetical protein
MWEGPRGPIPVEEALNIAKQIAEALEAAHEKGVIHRDLKPGNIMLTSEGKVKVLDFGLAKALESQTTSNLSTSPTLMSAMSSPGVILGTASYMSPEQAKGRAADKRTDIFAFGCVLYEMLMAKRAFDGDDVADILGAVLKTEPDWTRLPVGVPLDIRKLLRLCLDKNIKNRRSDATDVRLDIELALKDSVATGLPATSVRDRFGRLAWILAAAMTIAFLTIAAAYFKIRNAPEPDEMRVDIATPPTQAPWSFSLSPDGKSLVFVASGDSPQRLWLRRLDKADAQPLAGTDDGNYPFWSPDNRSIAFFANGKLKRIDLDGSQPRALADALPGRGGTWGMDNTILFAPSVTGPLLRLNASAGEPSAATKLTPEQTSHRWPQFLPDGKSFLYYVQGSARKQGIYIGSTDGAESTRLIDADAAGAYLPPDHIVFVRQTALLAQRFDASSRTHCPVQQTRATGVRGEEGV